MKANEMLRMDLIGIINESRRVIERAELELAVLGEEDTHTIKTHHTPAPQPHRCHTTNICEMCCDTECACSDCPHTSPPAPACPHFGIVRVSYSDGVKNEWGCLNPLTEARKAAAAKAARKQVLSEVFEAIEHQKDHKEFLLPQNYKDIVLDIIDGIRAHQEQP